MKHRLICFASVAAACVLLLCGCGDKAATVDTVEAPIPFEDFPMLDGSTANLPLLRALAQRYTGISADEAEVKISVSTTDQAYYALSNELADLLIVYEASENTKEYLDEYGQALEMKPIGLDALVFLCNEGNPIDSLTTQQIRDIYTGRVTNWSELGGTDIEIVPYQRILESGSQTMMLRLVMNEEPIMEAPSELMPGGMGGLVDQIMEYQNTANAIGYSVYYYIQNMYAYPEIKMIAVDGVQPSNESIQDGSYPFVNEFYAVIRASEPADSLTREVYDFLSTEEGRALLEETGYVPVR